MDEILEHFDDHNQLLGTVTRQEAYTRGLNQRAAHVIIGNSEGKFLVQQRAAHKSTWANAYDLSSAETASPGEDGDQTARRGLREELAITDEIELRLVRDWYLREYRQPGSQSIVRGFVRLFVGQYDGPIAMDENEVQWFDWLLPSEIDVLHVDSRVICSPWFIEDWRYFRSQV